ncbi:MAG TPA: hypothetical protein VFZ73_19325 [Gemmatimonadaceae bacterium]
MSTHSLSRIAANATLIAAVVVVVFPDSVEAQRRVTSAFPYTGTEARAAAAPRRTSAPQGAPNPRLLPDISLVGDLIGDLSPDGSTQEDGTRLGIREVELALQAAVDPTFRGDVFLGFSDAEGVHIEQAFVTATSLPIEIRLGRFLSPFGKQNTTHRHDLHTIDHSLIVQRFLGEEGMKSTGLYLAHSAAPLGFFQELILTAGDGLAESEHEHEGEELVTEEPINKDLDGLAYSARLRNYWDLSNAANIEVSGSVMTGRTARELDIPNGEITAVPMRQTTFGADVTFRWRPPGQGLYKSFILQSEFMAQQNDNADVSASPAPVPLDDFAGFYVFGRYQISRRGYLGARFDSLDDPEFDGERTTAIAGIWQFYPSEFSKIVAKFERVSPKSFEAFNRLILQATFALGPHKPHPF